MITSMILIIMIVITVKDGGSDNTAIKYVEIPLEVIFIGCWLGSERNPPTFRRRQKPFTYVRLKQLASTKSKIVMKKTQRFVIADSSVFDSPCSSTPLMFDNG